MSMSEILCVNCGDMLNDSTGKRLTGKLNSEIKGFSHQITGYCCRSCPCDSVSTTTHTCRINIGRAHDGSAVDLYTDTICPSTGIAFITQGQGSNLHVVYEIYFDRAHVSASNAGASGAVATTSGPHASALGATKPSALKETGPNRKRDATACGPVSGAADSDVSKRNRVETALLVPGVPAQGMSAVALGVPAPGVPAPGVPAQGMSAVVPEMFILNNMLRCAEQETQRLISGLSKEDLDERDRLNRNYLARVSLEEKNHAEKEKRLAERTAQEEAKAAKVQALKEQKKADRLEIAANRRLQKNAERLFVLAGKAADAEAAKEAKALEEEETAGLLLLLAGEAEAAEEAEEAEEAEAAGGMQ